MAERQTALEAKDAGLQPERTTLAWRRTLFSTGMLLAVALRHHDVRGIFMLATLVPLILLCAHGLHQRTAEKPGAVGYVAMPLRHFMTFSGVLITALSVFLSRVAEFIR